MSLYSMLDEAILRHSCGTLTICEYQGDTALAVIRVESIKAVVDVVPFGYVDKIEKNS